MTVPRAWLGASRRLVLSFILVLLLPAAAVVWLGARLIDQDRALASRQLRERRESAADRLVASLAQTLSTTERQLESNPTALPVQSHEDSVLITLGPGRVEAFPPGRVLYLPEVPQAPAEPTAPFEAGEALEFRARDYQGAATAFRPLADSASSAIRAGAWLRLGRTLKKAGRADDALAAYAQLAQMRDVRLSGLPADLVAEGHAIPIARVAAMHEGKRRARARRDEGSAAG